MKNQPNVNLPFFSYGVFRPGEISFLGIQEFVFSAHPMKIRGNLVLRDGITLFKEARPQDTNQFVSGYLLQFKPEATEQAYDFINSLEPKKLFRWKELTFETRGFNILYGIKPDRGSDNIEEANWSTIWEDPFFTSAMDVLEEIPAEQFEWDLKPLFRLQMKYMLLWTILERFSFLRYSLGASVSSRNKLLAENEYFKKALAMYFTSERSVFSAEDPESKTVLSLENPKKSLDYYYQVRCNITHRGKAVLREYDTVKASYDELFKITKFILQQSKLECKLIKNHYETETN